MPSLSVIIPTHERPKILQRCLQHLEEQSVADEIEVIVVSDGHDAKTAFLLAETSWRIPVRYEEIEKSQQGVARNHGVGLAQSPLCLFIGDDIFLEECACEHHLSSHQKLNDSAAVLGFTTWDPAVGITPVMRWLEKSGWQFGYPMIEKHAHEFVPKTIQHLFTYTSQISLPTEIAKRVPFRDDVSLYGWEDTEWGKRLAELGIRLYYESDARAFHHHHLTLEESLKRMETLGRSVHAFPEIGRKPEGGKRVAYEIAALFPTMAGKHRRAFLRGLKQSKR